ncbi:hypothetical protein T4C_11324 [Trichinella pseudospiralis]|uniref:Uncharacterized protein n=1 Tax=Trichinella pseudospiralis TaxID=6337 RepID=A0A0V1HL00_TRIPS|nr:hypothetical protein T4C_11324 [Trichinella pseudospiralis]
MPRCTGWGREKARSRFVKWIMRRLLEGEPLSVIDQALFLTYKYCQHLGRLCQGGRGGEGKRLEETRICNAILNNTVGSLDLQDFIYKDDGTLQMPFSQFDRQSQH